MLYVLPLCCALLASDEEQNCHCTGILHLDVSFAYLEDLFSKVLTVGGTIYSPTDGGLECRRLNCTVNLVETVGVNSVSPGPPRELPVPYLL
jgi:hypothetical protein